MLQQTSAALAASTSAATAPVKGWKVNPFTGESRMDLSRQWFARPHDERFVTLSALRDRMAYVRDHSRELVLSVGDNSLALYAPEIEESDDVKSALAKTRELMLLVGKGDSPDEVALTHWSFGQLAGLAAAPAAYLRKLTSQTVSLCLDEGLRFNRSRDEVKLYADELQALAITGPDYGRIFNVDVVDALMGIAGDGVGSHRWRVPGTMDWRTTIYTPLSGLPTKDTTTIFGNDKGIFVFLVDDLHPIEIGKLPDGSPDLVFRGFYITNSEVGAGALKIAAFYLRAICCNRIMWGVEGFQEVVMRHAKYAPDRFVQEAVPALQSFANGSESKLIDAVAKAREATVAETKADALQFLQSRKISAKRSNAILAKLVAEERQGDETDRPISAWDIAQGITAEARDLPNVDDRLELEMEAKKILEKVAA